jgi:MFS superfamily sulfate permease-like transporter
MVIYAALGTSRVLSVSTATTLAILTAAQLEQVVPNGNPAALLRASATLTLLVGAALLLACLLRLGIVANFISEPVLVGFRAGIGLVIVVDQIPKILASTSQEAHSFRTSSQSSTIFRKRRWSDAYGACELSPGATTVVTAGRQITPRQ